MNEVLLKIDPYCQTVTEVAFTDSLSQLCGLLHARRLATCLTAGETMPDCVLVDADIDHDGLIPPAWVMTQTREIFYGTGLIVYVSEEGQYRPPLMNQSEMMKQIEFTGFMQPDLVIDFADLDLPDELESQ